MKICVMTSVYAFSDTNRNGSFLVESTKHLVARGHEVHVFAPSYEGLASHSVHGVPVYRFRYFFRRWEHLTHGQGAPNRIRNPLYLGIALCYVVSGLIHACRFCRRQRFDVIHVHWPFPHGLWGYAAGTWSRTPVVLTFHGAELLLSRRFKFVTYFLRHAAKHAKHLFCNSTYTARQVGALTDQPVEVLPFGCTVDARPAEKDPGKAVKDILFVGRLIRRKGLDTLLQALPRIGGQIPVTLHVVGDGPMAEAWRTLARRLGVESKVVFHGVLSNAELERRYSSADVFVLPAIVDDRGDTEGLGVVLIEALSFGVPVVASDVGGIGDIVIHDRTGLLVPAGDVEALAQAVHQILAQPDRSKQLAEEGLKHVQRYFDWRNITERLIDAYRVAAVSSGRALAS